MARASARRLPGDRRCWSSLVAAGARPSAPSPAGQATMNGLVGAGLFRARRRRPHPRLRHPAPGQFRPWRHADLRRLCDLGRHLSGRALLARGGARHDHHGAAGRAARQGDLGADAAGRHQHAAAFPGRRSGWRWCCAIPSSSSPAARCARVGLDTISSVDIGPWHLGTLQLHRHAGRAGHDHPDRRWRCATRGWARRCGRCRRQHRSGRGRRHRHAAHDPHHLGGRRRAGGAGRHPLCHRHRLDQSRISASPSCSACSPPPSWAASAMPMARWPAASSSAWPRNGRRCSSTRAGSPRSASPS